MLEDFGGRDALIGAPTLARSILGTADLGEVARRLVAFCEDHLGSGAAGVSLCELSVGAAFGVRLEDGRRVFVKAHPPGRPSEFLEAVHGVQGHLFRRGFPCPKPMAGPAPFGPGLATAEDFVDAGGYADAHGAGVRRVMARTLARLVGLAGEVPDVRGLGLGWNRPGAGRLWPEPHNALFDLEATARGGGWIDEVAAGAKETLDGFRGGVVVGHADWCSKHFRFRGGEAHVVYDWDSLGLDNEPAIVGAAAAIFPANRHLGTPNLPSPEETWLFAGEYEAARGAPFSGEEREVIAAAAIYALAYLARCEHASDPGGLRLRGGYREALPAHAEAYLRPGA